MSEFDKLMKGGSKRKDVQNRQIKNEKKRKTILWTLVIYFPKRYRFLELVTARQRLTRGDL